MSMIPKVTQAVGMCCPGRSRGVTQFKLFERGQHARASLVLELVTPSAHALLAQSFIIGPERQAQLG